MPKGKDALNSIQARSDTVVAGGLCVAIDKDMVSPASPWEV